jgi:hypothetical protein
MSASQASSTYKRQAGTLAVANRRKGVSSMSAYLVSMRTINQIVAAISSLLTPNDYSWIAKQFAAAGIDTSKANWEETLAKAMFALNWKAVYADRFGNPAPARFIYEQVELLPNLYQTLKAVHCWLDQCWKGDIPQSKLYQFIDTFVRVALLEAIIRRLPDYEKAQLE